MDPLPNLIRLPSITADAAGLSTVFPRLHVGMVLTALVLAADGEDAVIRFRGMDVNAKAQLPLRAGERITLVVSELSGERVVLRATAEEAQPGASSITDEDLGQILTRAALPRNKEGLAAVRALMLNGKALTAENIGRLVTAARSLGDFSQPALDAIIFLTDRDLPVSAGTVKQASAVLRGVPHPAQSLAELEFLVEGKSGIPPAPPQRSQRTSTEGGDRAAPAASPPAQPASHLPPAVVRSLQKLLDLFPRLELGPATPANGPEPGAARPSETPIRTDARAPGTATPPSAPGQTQTVPSGGAPAPVTTDRPAPAAIPPVPPDPKQAAVPPPSEGPESGGEVLKTPRPALARPDPPAAAGADRAEIPIARQLAGLVRELGTSLEARLATQGNGSARADLRAVLNELQRDLDSAVRGASPQTRAALAVAQMAVRELSDGLNAGQFLNAAPPPRDDPGAYFLFQLPVRTPDGWETGELRIYRRDPEKELDPENASILLSLNMRHLGPVTVAILVRNGAVSCDFRCERSQAIAALQGGAQSLEAAIEALGHPVRSIDHQLVLPEPQAVEPRHDPAGRIDTRA